MTAKRMGPQEHDRSRHRTATACATSLMRAYWPGVVARHQRYGVGDPHDEIYVAHMYINDGVGKGWNWDLAMLSVVGSGVG